MKHKQSTDYRLLGKCKYCNQEIYGTHSNKFQAHQRFCKQNPDRYKSLIQIKTAGLNGNKISNQNKHQKSLIRNEKHQHFLQCKKCGNTYELWVSDINFERGNYSKHCSYKCSNSRNHSDETKYKIGKTVKKEHEHICPKCGHSFMHIGTSKMLCDNCFKETYNRERGTLNANKYIQTNESKYSWNKLGNDTCLHLTNCTSCGKEIWCKTTDDVYCYECANELGKIIHQLYTPFGKKLISQSTINKLSKRVQERIKNGTHNGWQRRNIISYAEKFWTGVLDNNNIKYEREVIVQPYLYSLDFKITLPNGLMIDLEIDGKQHLYEDRIQHDKLRNKRIREKGYLVYRIPWNSINTKIGKMRMKAKIKQFLWWFNKMYNAI